MSYIWSIFFALLAGVSIVLSRSVNALLAEKIGALSSSFFNYASGLLASLAFLLLFAPHISPALPQLMKNGNAILLMGGVIGVINIILLNRIVTRIPPLQLTLIVFVAQLASGMLLDYFLLDLFSMRKLIGCSIVVIGLLIHNRIGLLLLPSILKAMKTSADMTSNKKNQYSTYTQCCSIKHEASKILSKRIDTLTGKKSRDASILTAEFINIRFAYT